MQTELTDDRIAKALAHPLRARILTLLEGGAASPVELAAELDAPLGNVSYHVRQLAAMGLLELVSTTPRRGAIEHHYELTVRPPAPTPWRELPRVARDAIVSTELEKVAKALERSLPAVGFGLPGGQLEQLELTLDARGREAVGRQLETTLAKLRDIERASTARLEKRASESDRSNVVLMHFAAVDEPQPASRGRRRAEKTPSA